MHKSHFYMKFNFVYTNKLENYNRRVLEPDISQICSQINKYQETQEREMKELRLNVDQSQKISTFQNKRKIFVCNK